VPAERFGHYELESKLGRGGMAEVWKVLAVAGPEAGREFALKRLLHELEGDTSIVEKFAMEAELARQLSHPNIVRVFDVGAVDGSWYQVMELVDGRDVGQLIKTSRDREIHWPVDFAVFLTRVLCEALDCAHNFIDAEGRALNLVHCDVAPSNVFVSRTGEIKLGDFGVARARVDSGAGEFFGKPYYVSPEALEGHITPSLDLWGAGVVLYELLTNHRPFTGKDAADLFAHIRTGELVPASVLRPDVPLAVDAAVQKALAPKQEDRFPTARAFADALSGLYDANVGTPLAISAVVRGLFGD
jgi:serine/threonine-protein kinase